MRFIQMMKANYKETIIIGNTLVSVSEFDKESLTLLYKVLGHGTKDMSSYEKGKKFHKKIVKTAPWMGKTT